MEKRARPSSRGAFPAFRRKSVRGWEKLDERGAHMIRQESCPKRVEQVIAQKASSEWLLFNMSDGNYYSLNDIGGRVWELCDGTRTVSQLVASISAEYDASIDEVEKDVVELLEGLKHGKLLIA
jgi:hypothetical protein